MTKDSGNIDPEGDGTSSNNDGKSYLVGYGRPPKHSQFKKGKSGNKSGRPKKILSPDDMLAKELLRKRTVTIDGITVELTGLEILYKQQFKMALKGNAKSLAALINAGENLMRKLQKAAASVKQSRFRTYTREELDQMTAQQLSDLYRESLAEEHRIEQSRRSQADDDEA